jgi:hypothetical protein
MISSRKIHSINVADPAARRAKKIEAQETKEAGKSKTQMMDSKRRLETTKIASNELVTNVRIGFVSRESGRRVDETKKADVWKTKRSDVDHKVEILQKDIDKEWSKVLAMRQPQKLQQVDTHNVI